MKPSWRQQETWRRDESLVVLPNTTLRGDYGEFGLEEFPAGVYPSCSKHGAMARVSPHQSWWRCLVCHNGCELVSR